MRGGATLEAERGKGRCACTGEWERERDQSLPLLNHVTATKRSQWLLPPDRYAYAHVQSTTINTLALEQEDLS